MTWRIWRGKYVLLDFLGVLVWPLQGFPSPSESVTGSHYGPQGLEVINITQENGADARKIWLKAVEGGSDDLDPDFE